MKKEESKVIAQKFQKIPNGTLALKHCRAGGIERDKIPSTISLADSFLLVITIN